MSQSHHRLYYTFIFIYNRISITVVCFLLSHSANILLASSPLPLIYLCITRVCFSPQRISVAITNLRLFSILVLSFSTWQLLCY
jgi:hypothetical protein